MLRQALILAAGRGRPVAAPDVPNCLATVGGTALLLRWLRVLRRVGVRRVGITLGWQAALVQSQVEAWRAEESVAGLPDDICFFHNPDWQRPNGLSVLVARTFVTEPVLLVMGDQIAAPGLVERLAVRPPGELTWVGVDRELSRVYDIDDATKVTLDQLHPGEDQTRRGRLRVRAMGKGLTDYQAVSTSLFALSPSLLACLDALPEPSLTEAVAEGARRGLVDAVDITGSVWQDVDSAEMRLHADWLLRAYGDELLRPSVRGEAAAPGADTLDLVERLLAEKDAPRYVLFNPGPVMTSAAVKAALVHHDICHRDEDYEGVVQRLRAKLRPVFGASAQHDILLLTASGTAAMEAALVSGVPPGKKLLVISNGAFGERLAEIAATHNMPHRRLALPWGELLEPEQVGAILSADPQIGAVAMMRHETSVGLLNPVAAVGRLCAERDVLLLVDAVSALGAEEVDVVADGIDICFSSSNKCLHSVAGVALVCVSPRVWPRIAGARPPAYYLDLSRYRLAAAQRGQTPFTPAVSAFFALETALDELKEGGGVPGRRELYRRRNLRIRRVLTSLGFQSFTNTGRESHTISTLKVPPGVPVQELYDRLKQRGYVIYKAKGLLQSEYVQVANMGELTDDTIDAFLQAITDVVENLREEAEANLRSRVQKRRTV
jgi:2-aminoethylphosphonate-pyruvate transaminase